jgi:hypothetical protein
MSEAKYLRWCRKDLPARCAADPLEQCNEKLCVCIYIYIQSYMYIYMIYVYNRGVPESCKQKVKQRQGVMGLAVARSFVCSQMVCQGNSKIGRLSNPAVNNHASFGQEIHKKRSSEHVAQGKPPSIAHSFKLAVEDFHVFPRG